MNIKTKLLEIKLKRASKNVDKWEKRYYILQRQLRDRYNDLTIGNIYDEAAQIEVDKLVAEAWKDGIVIKED